LQQKDDIRLDFEKRECPHYKWDFERWIQVVVKAILINQLMLGAGRLSDRLRWKPSSHALHTINDKLCLFSLHCSAPGARSNRCTKAAIELANQFFGTFAAQLLRVLEFTELKKIKEKFRFGNSENGTWLLIRPTAHYKAVGIAPMTIG